MVNELRSTLGKVGTANVSLELIREWKCFFLSIRVACCITRMNKNSAQLKAVCSSSLYELQVPAPILDLLTPALQANGLLAEKAVIYRSKKSYTYPKPYTYTQILGNKGALCHLLHIDNQFLTLHYFDNLAVMLQAFPQNEELIIFLDTSHFPQIQLRRLFESEGRVRYITPSDLEDLALLSKNDSFYWLADAFGLDERQPIQ